MPVPRQAGHAEFQRPPGSPAAISIDEGSTPGRSKWTNTASPRLYASIAITVDDDLIRTGELLSQPIHFTERVVSHDHVTHLLSR